MMATRRGANQPVQGPTLLERAGLAMGTAFSLRVWPAAGKEAGARRALARAVAYVGRAEALLSRFRSASEVARLNAGDVWPVSRLTFSVVRAALEAARATGGLFDPTVYRALLAAGYDRSFERLPAVVSSAPDGVPPVIGRYAEVALDPRRRIVMLPPGVKLDLGGIAKGWVADTLARRLARYGGALADLGGDIAVAGTGPAGGGWEIEIEDPMGGTRPLAVLRLRAGGVATSGVLRRRWQTAQGEQHHLIDPRTGRPAASDVVAATVVAPTATAAEVAAKAALLLGAEQGKDALDANPHLEGLLVTAGGVVVCTRGWGAYLME